MAQSGRSVPTYAYALNNPLWYIDPNGLDPRVPYSSLGAAAADARSYLYRTHSPDALLHEWGTTFYRHPDGRVEYSEPETMGTPTDAKPVRSESLRRDSCPLGRCTITRAFPRPLGVTGALRR